MCIKCVKSETIRPMSFKSPAKVPNFGAYSNLRYPQDSDESNANQARHSMVVKPNGQKTQLELNDNPLVKDSCFFSSMHGFQEFPQIHFNSSAKKISKMFVLSLFEPVLKTQKLPISFHESLQTPPLEASSLSSLPLVLSQFEPRWFDVCLMKKWWRSDYQISTNC